MAFYSSFKTKNVFQVTNSKAFFRIIKHRKMLLYFSVEAFYGTIRQLKIIFSLFYSSLKNALKVTNSKAIFRIINYQKL